jgi:hypothetical protein
VVVRTQVVVVKSERGIVRSQERGSLFLESVFLWCVSVDRNLSVAFWLDPFLVRWCVLSGTNTARSSGTMIRTGCLLQVCTGFGSYPIRLPPRSPSTARWTGFQSPYPGFEIVGVTHGVSPRSQYSKPRYEPCSISSKPAHRVIDGGGGQPSRI